MAVIVQYVVVRNGDEKMTFATKKEADAHDKMLDIADNLYEFFEEEELPLNEQQREAVSMSLARNRDAVLKIMKGGTVQKKSDKKKSKPTADSLEPDNRTPAKKEGQAQEDGGAAQSKKAPRKTAKKKKTGSVKGDEADSAHEKTSLPASA